MLRPEAAWERLAPHLVPLPAERLPRRASLGRVLASPLAATVDVPATDVSAMDGYAVGGEVEAGAALPVAGAVVAGDAPGFELPPGRAARIMTGATVPRGADRVVPVELTEPGRGAESGAETVTFTRSFEAGTHIRRRGEVQRVGEPLLPAGALLTPGALALLATHGIGEIEVRRAPRVALVVTGDEVVDPGETPRPGQLRDSHTDFLLAAGASLGIAFEPLGVARDRLDSLAPLIEKGLGYDVLLTTGGVSAGELDLVERVLADLDCETIFDAVAVQPGKPLVAARHARGAEGGAGLVFGLPGNPAGAMVGFWLFVRPALRRLLGLADGFWQGSLSAELAGPLPGAPVTGSMGRDRFLSAEIAFEGGRVLALPHAPVGSHDLGAYGRGTALVRIRAGDPPRGTGESCEVLPLADWRVVGLPRT